MHRDDLSKVATLWLSITEDVREDPEVRYSSFFTSFCKTFREVILGTQLPVVPIYTVLASERRSVRGEGRNRLRSVALLLIGGSLTARIAGTI